MIKVLNEENHALRMLEEGLIFDNKVGYELSLLAKYYIHRQGLNRPQTKEKIIDFCNINIKNFDAINWRNTINKSIENGKKYNFINVDGIDITKEELNKITSIKNQRSQKIMFVLLVISKMNNKLNELISLQKNKNIDDLSNKYYVNDSISSIVKLSKMNLKSEERYKVLRELQDYGFIEVTTKGKFRVMIVDNNSEKILHINRLDDFIYDYLGYIGKKIKMCEGEGCDKRILVKGNSTTKYCKECAKKYELAKHRERNKKHYKNKQK